MFKARFKVFDVLAFLPALPNFEVFESSGYACARSPPLNQESSSIKYIRASGFSFSLSLTILTIVQKIPPGDHVRVLPLLGKPSYLRSMSLSSFLQARPFTCIKRAKQEVHEHPGFSSLSTALSRNVASAPPMLFQRSLQNNIATPLRSKTKWSQFRLMLLPSFPENSGPAYHGGGVRGRD
jgi:hypothetical protein